MWRKRWFQAAVLALVLFAGVIALKVWGPKQIIRTIYLSPDEQKLTDLLETTVALKFEVGKRLPAGATITHWVEYYTMGEREDIALHTITLEESSRRLPIMLVAQPLEEQEHWHVLIDGHGKWAYVPRLPYTLRSTYRDSREFEYGKPVLIAYGIRGIEETSRPTHDWDTFAEGSVEPWLQNDNVWAFKVQIDLPLK